MVRCGYVYNISNKESLTVSQQEGNLPYGQVNA